MEKQGKRFPLLAVILGVVDLLLIAAICFALFFSKESLKSVKASKDSSFEANDSKYSYDEDSEEYSSGTSISFDGSSVSGQTGETEKTENTAVDSNGFIFPDSSTTLITLEQMDAKLKDKPDLRLAINEIYARHGYQFSSEQYQNYYQQFDWYNKLSKESDMDKVSASFSDVEKKNVDALQAYSKAHGWS